MPPHSRLQPLVLSILADGEMYGLEVVRVSRGQIGRGSVYVTLRRMEAAGLIASRVVRDPRLSGSPRRLFRLTDAGREALAAR